jgi:sulfur-oxidizing protein SoxY
MDRTEKVDQGRRTFLEIGAGATLFGALVAAGILKPEWARAADWNKAAFDAKTMGEAFAALGAGKPADCDDIVVTAPDIAENGAVVPVTAASSLAKTESIAFLIENNPNMLAASFLVPEGTLPVVTTRVKMARTSNVSVLVKADGKFYVATKEIKVTLGGCGG